LRALKRGFSPGKSDPVDPAGEVAIRLAPAARLWGRVTTGQGGPSRGAFVLVGRMPQGEPREFARRYDRLWIKATRVAVGPEGGYEVRDLWPGTYLVRAGARGHALSLPREVVLEEAGEDRLDFALEPGVAIPGRVVDQDTGAPIAGAWVHATPRDPGRLNPYAQHRLGPPAEGQKVFATTADDGSFSVQDLAAGQYAVRAVARGYLEAKAERVAAGGVPVLLRAAPSLEIRGVVTFTDGRPAAGLQVFADRASGERRRARAGGTSAEGRFVLSGLAPGLYRVTAGGRTAHAATSDPVPAGRTDLHLVADEAAPGEAEEQVQALEGDATLEGRIVDPSGRGIGGVRVYARHMTRPRELLGRFTRSRPDGRFVIRGLAAAPYQVRAAFDRGGWLPQEREGLVPGRDKPTFVFASVVGVIRGTGAGGRTIRARPRPYDKDKFGRTAVVGPDGRFEITGLPPGRYDIFFEAKDGKPHLLLEGGDDVAAGARDLVLRATRGARIGGIVVDEGGWPLEGATVVARRDAPREATWMKTGGEGGFELTGLRRGVSYDVSVVVEGRVPWKRRVEAPATGLRCVIETGLSAAGRLVDAKGRPCVRAKLRFLPQDADVPRAYAETDAEGRFTVTGLRDTEYRVEAWPKVVLKTGDPWPEWQPCGTIRARSRDVRLKTPGEWER
ncbi:MAG: carboxypeptidase regulatory-like domain-containing protein, partial [Planctomycetota bacterium]